MVKLPLSRDVLLAIIRSEEIAYGKVEMRLVKSVRSSKNEFTDSSNYPIGEELDYFFKLAVRIICCKYPDATSTLVLTTIRSAYHPVIPEGVANLFLSYCKGPIDHAKKFKEIVEKHVKKNMDASWMAFEDPLSSGLGPILQNKISFIKKIEFMDSIHEHRVDALEEQCKFSKTDERDQTGPLQYFIRHMGDVPSSRLTESEFDEWYASSAFFPVSTGELYFPAIVLVCRLLKEWNSIYAGGVQRIIDDKSGKNTKLEHLFSPAAYLFALRILHVIFFEEQDHAFLREMNNRGTVIFADTKARYSQQVRREYREFNDANIESNGGLLLCLVRVLSKFQCTINCWQVEQTFEDPVEQEIGISNEFSEFGMIYFIHSVNSYLNLI